MLQSCLAKKHIDGPMVGRAIVTKPEVFLFDGDSNRIR